MGPCSGRGLVAHVGLCTVIIYRNLLIGRVDGRGGGILHRLSNHNGLLHILYRLHDRLLHNNSRRVERNVTIRSVSPTTDNGLFGEGNSK